MEALQQAGLTPNDPGVTDTLEQWQQVDHQDQVVIGSALRDFREAERRFNDAEATLRAVLLKVDLRRSKRTASLYDEMDICLRTRLTEATDALDALERLREHQENGFDAYMGNMLQHHIQRFEGESTATAQWLEGSKALRPDKSTKTDVDVNLGS